MNVQNLKNLKTLCGALVILFRLITVDVVSIQCSVLVLLCLQIIGNFSKKANAVLIFITMAK